MNQRDSYVENCGFIRSCSSSQFPLVVGRTGMLGILVGMEKKDRRVARCFHAVVHTPVVCNDRCHGLWDAELLSMQVVDISFVVQRLIRWPFVAGRAVPVVTLRDSPVLLRQGVQCPVVLGVLAVDIPVVVQPQPQPQPQQPQPQGIEGVRVSFVLPFG